MDTSVGQNHNETTYLDEPPSYESIGKYHYIQLTTISKNKYQFSFNVFVKSIFFDLNNFIVGVAATQSEPPTQYPTRQPRQVVIQPVFGPKPTSLQCPKCKQSIRTKTKKEIGVLSLIAVGVCCIL